MHDANGTALKVGDVVLIPAEITQLDPCEDYCNVTVKSTIGRRPDGLKETISAINTGVLILHKRAIALLVAAIVAVSTAAASGQTIEGPEKVDVGKPEWFSIADVPPNSQAVWIPNTELQAGMPYIRDGHALLFAESPGKRVLTAIVALLDDDKRLIGLVPLSKTIEVTGEAPPAPFPVNPYPKPSSEWETSVQSISETSPPLQYAEAAAKQFSRFARTVLEGNALQTTGDLQQLLGGGSSAGNFAPTRDAVAALIETKIGRENVPLDKAEAAAMLSAIAWAIWEAGHGS